PEEGGVIIINPPYGERMDTVADKNQYRRAEKFTSDRKVIIRRAAGKPGISGLSNTRSRLENLYQGIGDFFKTAGGLYRGYIFTGNLEMIKQVGLRTKQRIILYNGDIECRLLEYELYKGSRKSPVLPE
ncbi:MAG: hypothetical protein ABRQ31_05355, partial [Smithellaceae bacterium]